MGTDKSYYQLVIKYDGRVLYCCTDGQFRAIDRNNWLPGPKKFKTYSDAYAAYLKWALEHVDTAHLWDMQIMEVWIPYEPDPEQEEKS